MIDIIKNEEKEAQGRSVKYYRDSNVPYPRCAIIRIILNNFRVTVSVLIVFFSFSEFQELVFLVVGSSDVLDGRLTLLYLAKTVELCRKQQ